MIDWLIAVLILLAALGGAVEADRHEAPPDQAGWTVVHVLDGALD